MAYWYLNKTTNEPRIFGSIAAIGANTDLQEEALYYHFSRLKKKEYNTDMHRIVKTEIEKKTKS